MGGTSGTGKRKRKKKGPTAPVKAPWGVWKNSIDTGRYFVKTVKADGEEINATKKTTTLAIGDLLPNFPDAEVHPGSTWTTQMSLVGDIPDSTGIRVQAPMTFVAFENVITPNGVTKRCAKLESRFSLPQANAEKIGHAIQAKIGSGGAGGAATAQQGGMGTMSGPNSGGTDEEPIDFKVISTNVSRLIWFDIAGNQVVRSTDTVNTHYEEEEEEADDGGGAIGGGAGAGGGGTKVSYNLRITRYLDDRVPEPTRSYTNGRGTAHARDSVTDVTPQKAISGR
jgi:hypothetical protein